MGVEEAMKLEQLNEMRGPQSRHFKWNQATAVRYVIDQIEDGELWSEEWGPDWIPALEFVDNYKAMLNKPATKRALLKAINDGLSRHDAWSHEENIVDARDIAISKFLIKAGIARKV